MTTRPEDLPTAPEDLANRALDAIGYTGEDMPIGDMNEGTRAARVALRLYEPLRKQLLRAAHWRFARKQTNMLLVQDATIGQPVPGGMNYEYLMPSDCLQVLFVPNQSAQFVQFTTYSATPVTAGTATVTPAQMSGTNSDSFWSIQVGTILEIADDVNTEYVQVTAITGTTFSAVFNLDHPDPFNISGNVLAAPTVPGSTNKSAFPGSFPVLRNHLYAPAPYSVMSDIVTAEWGLSQFGSGVDYGIGAPAPVIVTNIRAAMLVYTADVPQIDLWDNQFIEAFCAELGARMCLAMYGASLDEKKLAMAIRSQQVAIAKSALIEARRTNSNEEVTTTERLAVWTRARYGYGGYGWGFGNADNNVNNGMAGFASFAFSDGSTL